MTQKETRLFHKNTLFKLTFQISKYTNAQEKFITMFNFQHSQINLHQFD